MYALRRTVEQGGQPCRPNPAPADRHLASLQTLRGKRPCSSAAETPLENGNTSQFRTTIANDHPGHGTLAGGHERLGKFPIPRNSQIKPCR